MSRTNDNDESDNKGQLNSGPRRTMSLRRTKDNNRCAGLQGWLSQQRNQNKNT